MTLTPATGARTAATSYFADLGVAHTAVVMPCSVGTVKSTLADARSRRRALWEAS